MLHADNISVTLGSTHALRGVSIGLDRDELTAIVGPNGSGKSTLVRTLAGVIRPAEGAVRLDGEPLRRLPASRRAARLGLLAQTAAIPPLMTVREHIGLGRHAARGWMRRWTPDDELATTRAINACEVDHLTHRKIEELSGGERQRVRLATLLAQDPAMLLLDEPLTGLDIEHQLALLDTLGELRRTHAKSVVCVLHDIDLALRYFRRIVVLHEGRLAADGAPRRVLCPALFRSVFRVEGRVGREAGGMPVAVCQRPSRSSDRPESGAGTAEIVTEPLARRALAGSGHHKETGP